MAEKIDPKVIKRTQDILGKVIKKPPLTEKFLAKPPFRYLHDLILEISRKANFFEGLYSGKELEAGGTWERDDKAAFLQKAINVVAFTTGTVPKVRVSKIMSGLESEKTNEFLQQIGMAVLKKLDSSEAIQRVLKGEKPGQPTDKKSTKEDTKIQEPPVDDKKKKKEPSSEAKEETQNSTQDTEGSIDKENEVVSVPAESENQSELPPSNPPQERPQHRPGTRRKTRDIPAGKGDSRTKRNTSDPLSSDGSGSGSQVQLDRPSTAKGQRKSIDNTESSQPVMTNESRMETQGVDTEMVTERRSPSPPTTVQSGIVPLSTRPSSSRPPAPRVIKRLADSEEPGSRTNSGQEKILPAVILDQGGKEADDQEEEDEEEEFVVQDSVPLPPPSEAFSDLPANSKPEGALAKTLMAAKERFEGEEKTTVPRSVTITEAQIKRERELVQKEVSKLQNSIQSLCQTANPLGKIMDYVQEDLDSMEQELEMWKKENSQHVDALRREERITEDELTPLKAQLEELNARINEQYDLISASKATILTNDQRIQQMLLSLNSHH